MNGGEIETLFVERIAQLLKPQGVAALIRYVFQPVAEDNVALSRAVHKQRYFCNAGKTIVFFDSVNVISDPCIISI